MTLYRVDALRFMKREFSPLLVIIVSMSTIEAYAAEKARFQWLSDAPTCPDAQTVEADIAGRLGYSPFDSAAATAVVARVEREGTGLVGKLERFVGGVASGKRTFQSPTADCAELAASMELAITIAIDPQALSPVPIAARPAPVPGAPTANSILSAPAPLPPEPVHLLLGVLGAGTVAVMPALSAEFGVQSAVRYRAFEVLLEGHGALPTSSPVIIEKANRGTLVATRFGGTLGACGVSHFFGACVTGSLSTLQITGTFDSTITRASVAWPNVGARVQGRFELGSIAFRPFLAVNVTLNRVTVTSPGGGEVWVSPPVSGQVGLAVAWKLF